MKFENRSFQKEKVNLNGNEFVNCQFHECELVFNGVGSISLVSNSFNGCRWVFEGPAADTVSFMKALYSMGGGGKDLILATFKNIAPDIKVKH